MGIMKTGQNPYILPTLLAKDFLIMHGPGDTRDQEILAYFGYDLCYFYRSRCMAMVNIGKVGIMLIYLTGTNTSKISTFRQVGSNQPSYFLSGKSNTS